MTEVECRVEHAVGRRQHRRDRVAEELHIDHVPSAVAARKFEQTLAGSDIKPASHPSPPLNYRTGRDFAVQPPDRAWKTKTSSSEPSGSLSRVRSRTAAPLT